MLRRRVNRSLRSEFTQPALAALQRPVIPACTGAARHSVAGPDLIKEREEDRTEDGERERGGPDRRRIMRGMQERGKKQRGKE